RHGRSVAEISLRHRAGTGRGFLSRSRGRGTGAAEPFQKGGAGLLGKWHGPRPVTRHVRQLPEIPDGHAGRVPPIAEYLRLYHRGRQSLRGNDHGGVVGGNPRVARGKIENLKGPTAEHSWPNRAA